ncbi:hypothetical protein L2E82_11809 [Cichorium intybus]|uniref:Uncharacterized protein n=1 Tax=Cichorium intybus TaxID=13427 RepID=A0ACB9GEC6_CICIN|nr:hypothetical protein L2E82_11809 [Cichorium intybus]
MKNKKSLTKVSKSSLLETNCYSFFAKQLSLLDIGCSIPPAYHSLLNEDSNKQESLKIEGRWFTLKDE